MKVLVTAQLTPAGLTELGKLADIELAGKAAGQKILSESELTSRLSGKQLAIVEFEIFSPRVIQSTDLKLIACTRGGPQANIDIGAASAANIPVLYAPGRNATAVVEMVFCLMVSVARNVARAHHSLKTGHFLGAPAASSDTGRRDVTWGVDKGGPYDLFQGPELAGRTLGIVGLGIIGRRLIERAKAFEMPLLIYDPYVAPDVIQNSGAKAVPLDMLLRDSDFITLHCNVTDQTKGLIGRDQIAGMKSTAILINTARGAIVDEPALIDALQEKRIAGAGLDVFANEPLPADSPLLALDNVTLVPHLGGASSDVNRNHTRIILEDIQRLTENQPPRHCANPEVLESFQWR